MADTTKKESHAGFYVIMLLLAIAIAGGGYWWFTNNNVDADKERTAQANQVRHKPGIDAKPDATTAGATASKPAPSAGHEVDGGDGK